MKRLTKPICHALLAILFGLMAQTLATADRPNILWIMSEDNSPFLGCYGDKLATTHNLNKLASQGFLYTHAYANAPVCAPTKNTIITGVYATSNGHQHMRSLYSISNVIKFLPRYMEEAGYACIGVQRHCGFGSNLILENNKSEKENVEKLQHSKKPFFRMMSIQSSHESSIFRPVPESKLIHDPAEVILPPYHPDTKEMRHDWALYYDKISNMDKVVGNELKKLEADGLADNTIVIYSSDHGGVLARSKRYVYETGTHIPFIIRIPKKYKHLYPAKKVSSKVSRLISYVDIAPTLLSIAGADIPAHFQGKAFLGEQKTADPQYAYMFRGRMDERYDMCRAVRDQKFRYIRNYMPYRVYGQHLNYLWTPPSIRSWEQAYKNGECNATQSIFWNTKPAEELYDTENDPWEVNNLAGNPQYKDVLERMSKANQEWMIRICDTGFIPEADMISRSGEMPMYDYMRSDKVDLKELIEAAETATWGDAKNANKLLSYIRNKDAAIRYWGATGLLILGDMGAQYQEQLLSLLSDPSPNVITVAAEALYKLGEKDKSISAFVKLLNHPEDKVKCAALNAIEYSKALDPSIKEAINVMKAQKYNKTDYAGRMASEFAKEYNNKEQ